MNTCLDRQVGIPEDCREDGQTYGWTDKWADLKSAMQKTAMQTVKTCAWTDKGAGLTTAMHKTAMHKTTMQEVAHMHGHAWTSGQT